MSTLRDGVGAASPPPMPRDSSWEWFVADMTPTSACVYSNSSCRHRCPQHSKFQSASDSFWWTVTHQRVASGTPAISVTSVFATIFKSDQKMTDMNNTSWRAYICGIYCGIPSPYWHPPPMSWGSNPVAKHTNHNETITAHFQTEPASNFYS